MGAFYLSDGLLFTATLVYAFVTGMVALQTHRYWTTFKQDPVILRIAVLASWYMVVPNLKLQAHGSRLLLLTTTVTTALGFYDYTHYNIWPDISLAWKVAIFLAHPIYAIVRIIFIYRVWRLSSKFWTLFVLAPLECFVDALGVFVSIAFTKESSFTSLRGHDSWAIVLWFISDSVLDWLITASLASVILNSRSSALPRTRNLLDRLLAYTIPTALLPSVLTVGAVISYRLVPDQGVWVTINAGVPSLYVNALLFSLNSRKNLRRLDDEEDLELPSGRIISVRQGQISNIQFANSTENEESTIETPKLKQSV